MYSSEDFERFYFQYQTEALSHGCFIWNFIGTFFKNIFNGAGIMLTWFLTKSLWLPANVKFKTD